MPHEYYTHQATKHLPRSSNIFSDTSPCTTPTTQGTISSPVAFHMSISRHARNTMIPNTPSAQLYGFFIRLMNIGRHKSLFTASALLHICLHGMLFLNFKHPFFSFWMHSTWSS